MKTKRSSYIHKYPRYGFDRNMANAYNYESYRYWLICDEGRLKPTPQRETNFMFKYGKIHPKTKRAILSYIPKDYRDLMYRWVAMTKHERNEVLKLAPDTGRKINHWLHQAEIMWYKDIEKFYENN